MDHVSTRKMPSIRMGQLAVARDDGVLRTLLGSCIGLVLYDRGQRIGGIAHVVLPDSRGSTDQPGKFVDTAVPALCAAMEECGRAPLRPTARLTGGANMFATDVTETIGAQNIEAAEKALAALRIPVVGRHCGGGKGRRVSLDTSTGVVTIDVVGCESVEL